MTKPNLKILTLSLMAGVAVMTFGAAADARGEGRERPAFSELDANGDGQLTLEEMQAHRAAHGAARFEASDTDGDGALSREEVLAAAQGRSEERAGRMFDRMDADSDGTLTQAEIEAGRPQRGDGEGRRGRGGPERMFERADADNSGGLSAEEFEALGQRGGKRGGGRH